MFRGAVFCGHGVYVICHYHGGPHISVCYGRSIVVTINITKWLICSLCTENFITHTFQRTVNSGLIFPRHSSASYGAI